MRALQISTTLVLALTVTACGPQKQGSSSSSRPYLAPTSGSGLPVCSTAIIADTRAFQKKNVDILDETATVMSGAVDPSHSADTSIKLDAINQSLTSLSTEYASKYGSAPCEFRENDQLYQIDPSKISSLANRPIEVKAVAQGGDCPEQMTADYRELLRATKGVAAEMMSLISSLMKKGLAGQSADAETAQITRNGQLVMAENEKFRSKHPGEFSCNSTDEAGRKVVLSSVEIDKNSRTLESNLSQMNN